MPELPDIETYLSCLAPRILGEPLEHARVRHFFFVRTVEPPLAAAEGRRVTELRRLGKRIVFGLEDDLFLVFHLMIAGRFRWRPSGARVPGKFGLAAFDFPTGTLLLTEAGTKTRASLHVVRGEAALAAHDPGGLEPLTADLASFRAALTRESHTLKRALTDPHLISGIGNAFSDEILHRARLSPFVLTGKLDEEATKRLLDAARAVLTEWTRGSGRRRATPSRRRSRRSSRGSRCTAATGTRARIATPPCSGSSTPTTRRTTARPARPAVGSWRTARSPGSSKTIGRGASTNCKLKVRCFTDPETKR